jgi:hypothetical protein
MTPEQMQALIDGLRPNMEPIQQLQDEVNSELQSINSMTGQDRQNAMDALVNMLVDRSEEIDVYERDQAQAFSNILKRVYDADVSADLNDPDIYAQVSRRADFLQRLRSRVSQGDRRFGIIRNSDRIYVSELFPTYAEAENAMADRGIYDDEHSVLEHMGEAWESFLALNRPFDEWQKYITAYNARILASLVPLASIKQPQPEPQAPAAPPVQPQAPGPMASRVRSLGNTPVPMLDPLTGLVQTMAPSSAPPNSRALPPQFSTGDRDRFGRKVMVEASLAGLDRWIGETYRSHGDAHSVQLSPAGGIIAVTVIGDTDNWRGKVESLGIPVALSITEDSGERSITFAYL